MFTERVGCAASTPAPRCRCSGQTPVSSTPDGSLSLAIAYVPKQLWQNVYCPAEGLNRGTIFGELDLPWTVPAFAAGKCKNGGCTPCVKKCN